MYTERNYTRCRLSRSISRRSGSKVYRRPRARIAPRANSFLSFYNPPVDRFSELARCLLPFLVPLFHALFLEKKNTKHAKDEALEAEKKFSGTSERSTSPLLHTYTAEPRPAEPHPANGTINKGRALLQRPDQRWRPRFRFTSSHAHYRLSIRRGRGERHPANKRSFYSKCQKICLRLPAEAITWRKTATVRFASHIFARSRVREGITMGGGGGGDGHLVKNLHLFGR